MKPEATANRVLSTTRARAKMHEFRVAPEDFIQLYRDPSMLFDLAVGILGDVASVTANEFRGAEAVAAFDPDLVPTSWAGVDLTAMEGLRFASTFFDAYLNARLDETISVEFFAPLRIGLLSQRQHRQRSRHRQENGAPIP